MTASMATPPAHGELYSEQIVYGRVGGLDVLRVVRADLSLAITHVVILGHPKVGPTFIASFPDTEDGNAMADHVGVGIVKALRLAATPTTMEAAPAATDRV